MLFSLKIVLTGKVQKHIRQDDQNMINMVQIMDWGAVKYECIHTYFHGAVNICKLKIRRNQAGLLNV